MSLPYSWVECLSDKTQRHLVAFAILATALPFHANVARADLYVASSSAPGYIGKYTNTGNVINAQLIAGINYPEGIALDGNGHLFVVNYMGPIGEYTTTGEVVNASLFSLGNWGTKGIALDGEDNIFVTGMDKYGHGLIAKYSISSNTLNTSFITGLDQPEGIVLDGNGHIFVANYANANSYVGEYTTLGETVNRRLISSHGIGGITLDENGNLLVAYQGYGSVGSIMEFSTSGALLNDSYVPNVKRPEGIALDGNDHIFVVHGGLDSVGEYSTSGAVVNDALISTGLSAAQWIAVDSVPEPDSFCILVLGATALLSRRLGRAYCSFRLTSHQSEA
jgi:sugar lactone lactonase YvrE